MAVTTYLSYIMLELISLNLKGKVMLFSFGELILNRDGEVSKNAH